MKINTKKLAAGPVMAAALLCAVSVGVNAPGISNVYAATVTESTGTSQTKRSGRKRDHSADRMVKSPKRRAPAMSERSLP